MPKVKMSRHWQRIRTVRHRLVAICFPSAERIKRMNLLGDDAVTAIAEDMKTPDTIERGG